MIELQDFDGQTFDGDDFAKISHCTFKNCRFKGCKFDRAMISASHFIDCDFDDDCTFYYLDVRGAWRFEGCNIEVRDMRLGGRGHVVVLNHEGGFCGCARWAWEAPEVSRRQLLRFGKKDAVVFWDYIKGRVYEIGQQRGWC